MSAEILPKTLIQNFFAEKLVKSTETAALANGLPLESVLFNTRVNGLGRLNWLLVNGILRDY